MFNNQLHDLVVKDLEFENGSLVSKERNDGEVRTSGIEFIISNDLTENIFSEFSITYQKSVNEKNKNIDVGYSPEIVSHARFSYNSLNTTVSLLGRYISSMETIYDLTKQNPDNTFGDRVGDKIDGYFVLDFNFRQDNISAGMYFNLKISNVLNQETNELLDRGTLGAERMIIGTIGIKF